MSDKREYGLINAEVVSLDDTEKLGRIQVKYSIFESCRSDWARLVTPMAGPERGLFLCPEVGDEVLVAFVQGDIRCPYIIGSVWSTVDKPPPNDGKTKDNNWRFIKSRSGHIFKFDDTKGKEKIEIIDKDGKHKVVIDTASNNIQITCDTGNLEISAKSGKLTIDAKTVEIHAGENMTLKADNKMKIVGTTIDIN